MGLRGGTSRGIETSPELLNSRSTKTIRSPRLVEYWISNDQWLECDGNTLSRGLRGTSGEQQMKLAIADEAYVSDLDTRVVLCGGWVPVCCGIQMFRHHPQRLTK